MVAVLEYGKHDCRNVNAEAHAVRPGDSSPQFLVLVTGVEGLRESPPAWPTTATAFSGVVLADLRVGAARRDPNLGRLAVSVPRRASSSADQRISDNTIGRSSRQPCSAMHRMADLAFRVRRLPGDRRVIAWPEAARRAGLEKLLLGEVFTKGAS
jgi:hypothetical protein